MVRRTALALALVLLVGWSGPSDRAAAGTASGVVGAAETSVSVTGELQRIAVDMRDGTSYVLTVVVEESGGSVRVAPGRLSSVPTGSVVRTQLLAGTVRDLTVGTRAGGSTVLGVEVLTEAPARPVPDGTPRDVHLVRAGFAGTTVRVPSSTEIARIRVAPLDYFATSTQGAVDLTVASQIELETLTLPSLRCTDAEVARLLGQAGGFGAPGSGEHAVLLTAQLTRCPVRSVAHVADGGAAWVNGLVGEPIQLATHALGHTLGLGHSDVRVCPGRPGPDGTSDQCDDRPRADAYDAMGYRDDPLRMAGLGPLGAPHLDTLGLLTGPSTVDATGPGPVELASTGLGTGVRFLRLDAADGTYYVEYRGRHGTDTDLGWYRAGCPEGLDRCDGRERLYDAGVVVRRVDARGPGADSVLLDAGRDQPGTELFVLPVGATFTTNDGTWSVTATDVLVDAATVTVAAGTVPRPVLEQVTGRLWEGVRYTRESAALVRWSSPTVGSITGAEVLVNHVVRAAVGPEGREVEVPLEPGRNVVTVRTLAAAGPRTATTVVVSDQVAPVVLGGPTLRLRRGAVSGTQVPVQLTWRIDDPADVHQVELRDEASTVIVLPGAGGGGRYAVVRPGRSVWDLTVEDHAGNEATSTTTHTTALRSEAIATRTGSWTRASSTAFLHGSRHHSSTPGSTMTFTTDARGVGWVAGVGGPGRAELLVDGVSRGVVDLPGGTVLQRRMVQVAEALPPGEHTVTVVVRSGFVAVDGFVEVR